MTFPPTAGMGPGLREVLAIAVGTGLVLALVLHRPSGQG